MNEQQRATINKKMDRLRLTPRRKTNWGKGFTIPAKKTDIECVESFRFEQIAIAKERLFR
jgi:hypothetical protein